MTHMTLLWIILIVIIFEKIILVAVIWYLNSYRLIDMQRVDAALVATKEMADRIDKILTVIRGTTTITSNVAHETKETLEAVGKLIGSKAEEIMQNSNANSSGDSSHGTLPVVNIDAATVNVNSHGS